MLVQSNRHSNEIIELHTQIAELERKNRELSKQNRINESFYLSIFDAIPINIFVEDPEGHTIYANKQACLANGKNWGDLICKTIFDVFPQEIAEVNRVMDLEVWKQRKLITKEAPAGFKGEEHHMFSGKTIIHIMESNEDYLLGFALDITDRVRAEKLLRESEEKFRSLIEQAADSFFLIGTDGGFTDVNPTACEMLGYSRSELLIMKVAMIFSSLPDKIQGLHTDSPDKSSSNFEDVLTGKNNTGIPVDINIRPIQIGENKMYFALCRDIRGKKRDEAQIKYMAYHDPLTELQNRWHIRSYIQEYIENKDTIHSKLGFILLDLDHFKVINDSFGHDAGDLLLKKVSKRLMTVTEHRESILARFGGDEFILLVPHLVSEEEISIICEKITQCLLEPFYICGQKFTLSASLGISIYPKHGDNLNTLIKNADIAMYGSKENGRN